jgi:hypothetical protein
MPLNVIELLKQLSYVLCCTRRRPAHLCAVTQRYPVGMLLSVYIFGVRVESEILKGQKCHTA